MIEDSLAEEKEANKLKEQKEIEETHQVPSPPLRSSSQDACPIKLVPTFEMSSK